MTPNFFCISGTSNSLSDCNKNFKKFYRVENFRANVLEAILHEAIFLATCNATNVALQVARKNSRVTPQFATAIVALRVARKVERPSTFRNVARQLFVCLRVTSPLQLATQFCQNRPIRAHLSQDVGDLARSPSCL